MFERRLSDGSVSKDRVEVVVDSTLPAHIRQENFWNSAFKEHDPSEHDSKIKIRQEQRALGQTLETRRALLRSTDMNLKDIPYVFDELLKRTRPEYQRQKGFQKNIQALPNILSETSALAGLFVRTHEVLDMETWDSVRFPKSILSYSEEVWFIQQQPLEKNF